MKTDVFAFVDEFGDTNIAFDKKGATTYFIITAVVVSEDLERHRKDAEQTRAKFFQTGEMKSSTIGTRDDRRLDILAELAQTEIRTYTLAVDKRELHRGGGLAHKASFFKYLNRMLYENVCRAHDSVAFVADQHGGNEFMDGFKTSSIARSAPLYSLKEPSVSSTAATKFWCRWPTLSLEAGRGCGSQASNHRRRAKSRTC